MFNYFIPVSTFLIQSGRIFCFVVLLTFPDLIEIPVLLLFLLIHSGSSYSAISPDVFSIIGLMGQFRPFYGAKLTLWHHCKFNIHSADRVETYIYIYICCVGNRVVRLSPIHIPCRMRIVLSESVGGLCTSLLGFLSRTRLMK